MTGPSDSRCVEDRGSPALPGDQACRVSADSIHRQVCRQACGDAANGPSDSDCCEDSGNLAGEVRRQSCGGACDNADAPVRAVALKERISARIHGQIVDQPGDQACRYPTWKTADAVRRQSCGCTGTVTGDDSSEESDCGSDRSSIFHRLMAKLLGNAQQEDHQVEEESSSWMDDIARSSWHQGKSAREMGPIQGWRKEGHDSWSWPETDGLGAGNSLSDRQTTVSIVHTDLLFSRSGTSSLVDSRLQLMSYCLHGSENCDSFL